jgi:hypothetical protein
MIRRSREAVPRLLATRLFLGANQGRDSDSRSHLHFTAFFWGVGKQDSKDSILSTIYGPLGTTNPSKAVHWMKTRTNTKGNNANICAWVPDYQHQKQKGKKNFFLSSPTASYSRAKALVANKEWHRQEHMSSETPEHT